MDWKFENAWTDLQTFIWNQKYKYYQIMIKYKSQIVLKLHLMWIKKGLFILLLIPVIILKMYKWISVHNYTNCVWPTVLYLLLFI